MSQPPTVIHGYVSVKPVITGAPVRYGTGPDLRDPAVPDDPRGYYRRMDGGQISSHGPCHTIRQSIARTQRRALHSASIPCGGPAIRYEIGRASCRERVWISVVGRGLEK